MRKLTPQRRRVAVLAGACAAIIPAIVILGHQDSRISNHADGLIGIAAGICAGVALVALRKFRAGSL